MIALHFGDLLEHSPDITLPILESMLSKRTDLSKPQLKDVLEACGRMIDAKGKDDPGQVSNCGNLISLF